MILQKSSYSLIHKFQIIQPFDLPSYKLHFGNFGLDSTLHPSCECSRNILANPVKIPLRCITNKLIPFCSGNSYRKFGMPQGLYISWRLILWVFQFDLKEFSSFWTRGMNTNAIRTLRSKFRFWSVLSSWNINVDMGTCMSCLLRRSILQSPIDGL